MCRRWSVIAAAEPARLRRLRKDSTLRSSLGIGSQLVQLDAKVNSQDLTVTMLAEPVSVHWQIADKTRDMGVRTRQLMEVVEQLQDGRR